MQQHDGHRRAAGGIRQPPGRVALPTGGRLPLRSRQQPQACVTAGTCLRYAEGSSTEESGACGLFKLDEVYVFVLKSVDLGATSEEINVVIRALSVTSMYSVC